MSRARGRDIGAGPIDDFIQVERRRQSAANSAARPSTSMAKSLHQPPAISRPRAQMSACFALPRKHGPPSVTMHSSNTGSVERGGLGVSDLQPVTADIAESLAFSGSDGGLVAEQQEGGGGGKKTPGGPARARPGIRAGDVLSPPSTGDTVKGPRELAKMIAAMDPGQSVGIPYGATARARDRGSRTGFRFPTDMAAATPDEESAHLRRLRLKQRWTRSASPSFPPKPEPAWSSLLLKPTAPLKSAAPPPLRAGDVIIAVKTRRSP